MEFHFYQEGCSSILDLFVDQLTERGADVHTHDCLCKHDLEEKLPKEVFCHPADKNIKCLQQVRRVVAANPYTQFYIFAVGRPEREEIIGEHYHVHYFSSLGEPGQALINFRKRLERS